MTREEAAAAVERVGCQTDQRVTKYRMGYVPWTARVLLGLEAAWAARPDAVLYMTVGLDPRGRQVIFQAVASRLSDSAAVHLCHEYVTGGRRERTCPPGAACVELREEPKVQVTPFPS
jgi:hypothetical protein